MNIFNRVLNKLRRLFRDIAEIRKILGNIQVAIGRVELRQVQGCKNNEFKVFSQWGEDGIIQHLINHIKISKEIFIEFGVENYTESNTRFLLINNNWSGLVIDGDEKNISYIKNDDIYWRYNLKAECDFITAENINHLFLKNGIQGRIGILSIDIDGNDYWVWQAIECVEPDIVICEYNHRFGKEKAVTVPYDPAFYRTQKHYSNLYYGASIKALTLLANRKGYALVDGNSAGNNVFFVRKELLNETIKECKIEDVFRHAQLRESRDANGKLVFWDLKQEQDILKNLELINVEHDISETDKLLPEV